MTGYLPLMLLGLGIAVCVAIFLVLRDFLGRKRFDREQRWKQPADLDDDVSLVQRLAALKPAADWSGRLDQGFERLLQRTGLGLSAPLALGFLAVGGLIVSALLYLWRPEPWLGGVGMVLALLVPFGAHFYLQRRWRTKLQDQLPDAFFQLGRSLRAGLSLEQALETVGEHTVQPVAGEFKHCAEHLKLGMTVSAALQLIASRIQLADFNGLVTIATLHRTTGGNLPFLLDRWAASTRDRNQFRGYFRSATALRRITAVALGLAAPALLVGYWLWQPEYISRFARSTTGGIALGVAGGLEIIGTLWMYYLARVDY